MKNLANAFKLKNLKLTPQRIAVYDILKNTKMHPSAESIFNEIKQSYPTMSLATIYKTLNTLVKVGLIQELNVGEGNFRYDANFSPHPHVICTICGKVEDIDGFDTTNIDKIAKQYTDYELQASKIYFYGICPKCKQMQV